MPGVRARFRIRCRLGGETGTTGINLESIRWLAFGEEFHSDACSEFWRIPLRIAAEKTVSYSATGRSRKENDDMSQQSRIKLLTAGCVAALMAGTIASGQEKVDPQNRRSITTSEWPSLKGVLAIGEVRNL